MITSKAYEERRLKLLSQEVRGTSVLDLGYAQYPNPYLKNYTVTGLDLNTPDVRSDYHEEIVGNVMEINEILGDRKFDTILCAELIEHLENPYELLRKLHSHLTENGRLILTTPNPISFPVVFAEVFRLKKFFYTRDHLYYFLPRWVQRMIEQTGYSLEAMKPIGLWTPWGVGPATVSMSYQVLYVAKKQSK